MNAADERARSLRERAEDWRKDGLIDAATEAAVAAQLVQPWRGYGILVQAVFFVLTAVAMGAFQLLFESELALGIVAIGLAELLIRKFRWFGTGVESALWLGGLLALVFALPSSNKPEGLLVIAAACAIAGARVRNPFFGAAAAALVSVYFEQRFDLGVLCALVLAAVALLALFRTWQRPTTEWLFIAVLLILPIAGRVQADEKWRFVTIALYLGFGIVCLAAALKKRHHAMFLAAAIALGIAATDYARTLPVAAEVLFFLAGALLLGAAWLISRALRGRTSGFVTTPAKLTTADDVLQIAATLAVTPPAQTESAPETRPQDAGGFGGAGATGDY